MTAIKVPPLGESIVEATVSRWLKNEGDAVAAGDTLVELETDKITVEVTALEGGVLASRSRNEGDMVAVGDTLVWSNQDVVPPTATAADHGWTTGSIAAGTAGRVVVTRRGKQRYVCAFHPTMTAEVDAR